MNLHGRVALVTGGALRLGREISMELARAGCHVAIHYKSSGKAASELVAEVETIGRRAIGVPGDLLDPASWPRIIERTTSALGALDILVNNASTFLTSAPDTLDGFRLADWDQMLRVNLTAPAALVKHARPYLEAGDGGRIVNLCDIAVEKPHPNHLSYVSAKAGLVALTKALAVELAPSVTVNGISPGIAMFPNAYDDSVRNAMVKTVPLGRAGTPADIARAVRFLVESGDYITGEILRVDGGRSLH